MAARMTAQMTPRLKIACAWGESGVNTRNTEPAAKIGTGPVMDAIHYPSKRTAQVILINITPKYYFIGLFPFAKSPARTPASRASRSQAAQTSAAISGNPPRATPWPSNCCNQPPIRLPDSQLQLNYCCEQE